MPDKKTYDFKSVGVKSSDTKQPNPNANVPIGIRTPMKMGYGSEGIFQMHFDLGKQIKDNLRNLLLTNHGERVGLYNFGANLRELSLELGSDLLDEELLLRINTAITRYMPFIEPDRLEREIVNLDNEHVAKIKVRLFYNVKFLRLYSQIMEISFFIGG